MTASISKMLLVLSTVPLIQGEEFEPNVLDFDNPMIVGNIIMTSDNKKFEYRGEDSLGRSIFTAPGAPIIP
jgi:hypothetical protein